MNTETKNPVGRKPILVMPAPRPINTGFRVTVEVAAWLKANGVGPIIETIVRERRND